jgi:Rap1a immunity proteins
MRFLTAACAALCLLTASAHAAEIRTGRDLVNACRDYMSLDSGQDNNATRRPHPCRDFLQGFFVSLVARQDAHREAMLKGLPYSSKEACVRMPDMLTYRDMAGRLINYGQSNSALLDGPAATLAQRTLERDFPCPKQTTPR